MNVTIEPAVNVSTLEEFRGRLRLVRGHAELIQVDVVDGIFARPRNVADPRVAARELRPGQLHIHVMTERPRLTVAAWRDTRPRRITIHVESPADLRSCFTAIHDAGSEVGLALGPETPLDALVTFLRDVDFVLLVSVPPGRSGQEFDPSTLDRLRALHRRWPTLPLGVDGGIRQKLLPAVIEAGATSIAIGSAVFDTPDPVATLREFQRAAARVTTRATV